MLVYEAGHNRLASPSDSSAEPVLPRLIKSLRLRFTELEDEAKAKPQLRELSSPSFPSASSDDGLHASNASKTSRPPRSRPKSFTRKKKRATDLPLPAGDTSSKSKKRATDLPLPAGSTSSKSKKRATDLPLPAGSTSSKSKQIKRVIAFQEMRTRTPTAVQTLAECIDLQGSVHLFELLDHISISKPEVYQDEWVSEEKQRFLLDDIRRCFSLARIRISKFAQQRTKPHLPPTKEILETLLSFRLFHDTSPHLIAEASRKLYVPFRFFFESLIKRVFDETERLRLDLEDDICMLSKTHLTLWTLDKSIYEASRRKRQCLLSTFADRLIYLFELEFKAELFGLRQKMVDTLGTHQENYEIETFALLELQSWLSPSGLESRFASLLVESALEVLKCHEEKMLALVNTALRHETDKLSAPTQAI